LDTALAKLPTDLAPIDWRRPLNAIHPALTDVDELARDLQRELPGSAAAEWFTHQLADNEATMRNLYDVLPSQLVHGDFGLSNCLVEDGRVTGVLDFEIAGLDLRLVDLAAGLQQSTDDLDGDQVSAFRHGYDSFVSLSSLEEAALPRVILHRALGTVVWRAGRWRAGHSDLVDVADRLEAAYQISSYSG
jgi:homoserine kinase type II